MATTPSVSWDETSPAGGDNVSAGDNRIRELKTQIRQVVDLDHRFDSSGQSTSMGYHNQCHFIEAADIGTGADGIPILGAQTIDSVPELVWTTEDDDDLQLTSKGAIDLGNGNLDNDEYLTASDNAGTLNAINLIKANTSDQAEIGTTSLHTQGLLLPEVVSTATAANQVSLYSKNDGTQSELYMREESNGDEVQITKGGVVNSAKLAFDSTIVFSSAAAPTTYADLDLSAVIGANQSVVMLRVESNSATSDYRFREKGMADDIGLSANSQFGGGSSGATVASGRSAYIVVATDSSGVVQWISQTASTTVVHMVAYLTSV